MQIICISRFSYGYGKELAERLADKLGYQSVAREELIDKATASGIPVGKLETAIVKRQLFTEELGIETDRFKAFMTASLCEQALKGGIVYHGRGGHLVLPGLIHVLRIRAIANMEDRIKMVMQRMNIARKQAKQYIEQVDEDRRKYSRFFYNVDCDDPSHYDIVVNAAHLAVDNSASALMHLAQLPEFQLTPALNQKIHDLLLESKCRLAIYQDERTRGVKVTVSAEKGNVSITYIPRHGKKAEAIPSVIERIDGVKSLICTVATTNILYVQEQFNPDLPSFQHLVEIAAKWNASVGLIRLVQDDVNNETNEVASPEFNAATEVGGILDDVPETERKEEDGYGMPETVNKLIQAGRAGACQTIHGGIKSLTNKIIQEKNYSLVVVGDVFLSHGSSIRKRLKRDMISTLSDQASAPVISTDEIEEQYLFRPKQWISTIVYALLSSLILFFVFTNQHEILEFLSQSEDWDRVLAIIAVTLFAPLAAYLIGEFSHNIMKFLKLE